MARRWTIGEEKQYRKELQELYTRQNKTIREIGFILNVSEQGVFQRLRRLGIETKRKEKPHCNNQRTDIHIPQKSAELAEFIGIMLGDGHISHFQTIVTLGTKEEKYVQHVASLMRRLFGIHPRILVRKTGHREVYIGSVAITGWLLDQGLVQNKVARQVTVPLWIFTRSEYMRACLRGFFDTDGSIYRLKFGIQISLTNRSLPLLLALQMMLKTLRYKPSEVSLFRVYLTRRDDVVRFFREIVPSNDKHNARFREFNASVG